MALLSACTPSDDSPRPLVTVARHAGTWQGRGDQTIGHASESGRFRIRWQVTGDDRPGTPTFRMTVHSAVSGRPIQLVADHRGSGNGTALFEDDPRLYNLMVESAHVSWSFTVEDLIVVDTTPPAPLTPPAR